MAKLSPTPLPGQDMGILHPLRKSRFVVQYRTRLRSAEELHLISKQTCNFSMDFKNKHISFEVEQPTSGDLVGDVQEFVGDPAGVTVHLVDGEFDSISRIQFALLECVSHELVMDYAEASQIAKHRITLKYQSITTKE